MAELSASLSVVAELACCGGSWRADISREQSIVIATDGQLLPLAGMAVSCDLCGTEYQIGYAVRSRQQSLASESFDRIAEDDLQRILADGVGDDDLFAEPAAELAMCARCDGAASPGDPATNVESDYCGGCREFVCRTCREAEPRSPRRHQVEAHWVVVADTDADAANHEAAEPPLSTDGDDFTADLADTEGW